MDLLNSISRAAEERIREKRDWLPFVGRILLVLTNIEDGTRILFDFETQASYLTRPGNHIIFPYWLSYVFLSYSLFAQLVGSVSIVFNKKIRIGVSLLLVFKVLAFIVYGLGLPAYVHAQGRYRFLMRLLSISGGLCMLIAHDMYQQQRETGYFAGLPGLMEPSKLTVYLQTAGRVLLAFQAIGMFNYGWVMGFLMLLPAGLVLLGFKTRYAGLFLGLVLFVESTLSTVFGFLFGSIESYRVDSAVYFMCQDLSILGGVLLLASLGPGGISLDGKKSF